jgi:hypothetical protein
MFPVVLFFFICFTLVEITEIFIRKHEEHVEFHFFVILISSLVMGKVVLISNYLPLINLFDNKPLIYNTVWKTLIYVSMSIVVRIIERLAPLLFDRESVSDASSEMVRMLQGVPFWISQMWLIALFLVFVGYQELIEAIGSQKVRKLFFGK